MVAAVSVADAMRARTAAARAAKAAAATRDSAATRKGGVVAFYRAAPADPRRFLVLYNADLDEWCPSKGFCRKGEAEVDAALRRLLVETGGALNLRAEDLARREDGTLFSEDVAYGEFKTKYYVAEVPPGAAARARPVAPDHADLRWLELDDALAALKHREIRNGLRRCADFAQAADTRPAGGGAA